MKMKFPYGIEYDNVRLVADRYMNSGALYLGAIDESGESICDISVNLSVPALEGYMYISCDMPEISDALVAFMEENGFGKKIREVQQGFCMFPLMELNLEKIRDAVSINKEAV